MFVDVVRRLIKEVVCIVLLSCSRGETKLFKEGGWCESIRYRVLSGRIDRTIGPELFKWSRFTMKVLRMWMAVAGVEDWC
jgi:hypothetical protein